MDTSILPNTTQKFHANATMDIILIPKLNNLNMGQTE